MGSQTCPTPMDTGLWRWAMTPAGDLAGTPGALDAARAELVSIAARLGPGALAAMPWPVPVLGDADRVRLLIDAGMRSHAVAVDPGQDVHDGGLPHILHHLAAVAGASLEVHALLDGIGAPPPPRAALAVMASLLASTGNLPGLRYLFQVHPGELASLAGMPGSRMGMLLAAHWWKAARAPEPGRAGEIVDFMVEVGVNGGAVEPGWEHAAEFDRALAAGHARAIACRMDPVPGHRASARPRL